MKILVSTNGHDIQISDEDFEHLNPHSWYVMVCKGKIKCAHRTHRVNGIIQSIHITHEIFKRRNLSFVQVDHKDRNPLNNQIENLRSATCSQNNANQRLRLSSTSGFKGVSYHKSSRKWQARIAAGFLGYFKTDVEAAQAYDKAAKIHFGEFALLNFPEA